MTKRVISILDYGASNLFNVVRAVRYLGLEIEIVKTEKEILESEMLILPGVGAFAEAMKSLSASGFDQAIRERASVIKKPILGICLGMQLLLQKSHEFGVHEGLGIVPGEVIKIPEGMGADKLRRIPHIGWAPLENIDIKNEQSLKLFKGIKTGDCVYFVHSYIVSPEDRSIISALSDYKDFKIPASICFENICALQFHPERSGDVGLRILKNALTLL